jgi:rubrerythrin
MFEEKIPLIPTEEISSLKDDLEKLHKRELFAKMTYTIQITKFEGIILETLKELLDQETRHAYLLGNILEQINETPAETINAMLPKGLNATLESGLAYDIEEEKQATVEYQKILEKVSSTELKEILEHILQEEFVHVSRLQRFLEEN